MPLLLEKFQALVTFGIIEKSFLGMSGKEDLGIMNMVYSVQTWRNFQARI